MELLSTLPENILSPDDIQPLRNSLDALLKFTSKYPKSAQLLATQAGTLKAHIAKFEAENVRYHGSWMARTDYDKIKETEKLAQESARIKEAKWQAEIEKTKAERAAFERAQRDKGLAEYNGKWLPLDQVKRLLKNEANAAVAWTQIKAKSVTEGVYSIFQVADDGMLIEIHQGKINQAGINTSIAFLFGAQKGMAADGDFYRGDLYWCGNYSYLNKLNTQKTVNAYCLTKNEAIARVTNALQGDTPEEAVEPGPDGGGRTAKAALPEILKGAKSAGSGFFVGRKGYVVTNAHVVENQSKTKIVFKGQTYDATVETVSKAADLALLKIGIEVDGLTIANTEAKPGSDVFAVGYPQPNIQGLEAKVTKGVISSSKGIDDDSTIYQIDAAIQPGNSGGPLCNTSGQLVGVIVSTLNPLATIRSSGSLPQNVNYAIKSSEVELFLRKKSVSVEVPEKNATKATGIDTVLETTVLVIVY
jgi:S1-C subfamily serine protease